jgi:hypothetical protein
MCVFLTRRNICNFQMLQGVLKDNNILQVSSARIFVNISGMVRNGEEVKVSK